MPDLRYRTKHFGWLKDYPSLKDYDIDKVTNKLLAEVPAVDNKRSKLVATMGEQKKPISEQAGFNLPTVVDNRKHCSPVRDQGNLGSCTAFMATGMYEYMCKRGHSKYIPLSPLFTYKSTRWLMHLDGDTGAYIRSALGSLAIHGSPPEEYWPYKIDRFEKVPGTLEAGFAQSFQALKYFRLDKGIPSDQTLVDRMKEYVAKGFCLGFGFTVFDSIEQSDETGIIPYPDSSEEVLGGHAVHIVGYIDDNFIIKNSWGTEWGEKGFGYIPMKYFIREEGMDAPLADDVWAITKYEWLDTDQFGFNDE